MIEKKKMGRSKKDPAKLLSESLQTKITPLEMDLVNRYCQANKIERAEFFRKLIVAHMNAWAKTQSKMIPESVATTTSVTPTNALESSEPPEKVQEPHIATENSVEQTETPETSPIPLQSIATLPPRQSFSQYKRELELEKANEKKKKNTN